MNEPKLHSILHGPHQYDVTDFCYHFDKNDPSQSFIKMSLKKNTEVVTLQFWQPINLKIEEGFPYPTRGMVFYDVADNGLENIGVEVSDFEPMAQSHSLQSSLSGSMIPSHETSV